MLIIKTKKVHSYEKGLYFKEQEFMGLLDKGKHRFVDPLNKIKVDVVSMRDPWLTHEKLDIMVKSGLLDEEVTTIDLKDSERALVWIDGRFEKVLAPGLYALWTTFRKVKIEIIDASEIRFIHKSRKSIADSPDATERFHMVFVDEGFKGLYFRDGEFVDTLGPGQHLFWKGIGKVKVYHVDIRETVLDVAGQEIMSRDKVSLRMNAVVNYRIADPLKSVIASDDSRQAIYREAQLAIRAVIGSYDLDTLLTDRENVSQELEKTIRQRSMEFGIEIVSLGIRDIILPGEMKELMNKVIEAQKAAHANLIMRREETAAMRSQANTARILESNPTLMRLKELDFLEKIAGNSKLSVVLGEKGLADRVVNLL
ncbi:MAG: slipin family protein [Deltaproteobacteria bacterium]|nr:slipin family protein [Deltaproteobacteria bacterium]